MGNHMVNEYSLYLMDKSILGNGRMDYKMDKVHTLPLMEKSILGNGRMGESGTPNILKKMEPFWGSMRMESG